MGEWINWALALLATFCAFNAWDANRCAKQTISNYLEALEDLRKQLAATREEIEDSHEAVDRLNAIAPKDYVEGTLKQFMDKAAEGADHSHSVILDGKRIVQSVCEIQPDKPWPDQVKDKPEGKE